MLSECDSADSWGVRGRGVGQIQCTEQALLQRSCGAAVPLCCWGAGGGGLVPECRVPYGKRRLLGGGPQPALPLLGHFPVRLLLVLVPPLLPPEEAELP